MVYWLALKIYIQHISVGVEVEGREISRSYTPVTLDDQKGHFDLLIKVSAVALQQTLVERAELLTVPNTCRAILWEMCLVSLEAWKLVNKLKLKVHEETLIIRGRILFEPLEWWVLHPVIGLLLFMRWTHGCTHNTEISRLLAGPVWHLS